MNGDVERLTPLWDLWFFWGGPLLQFFNGNFAAVYDREKLGDNGLELWLVEISLKCPTELFRVLLDEETKLAELPSSVFEWESCPIIVGGSEPRVDLVRGTRPSDPQSVPFLTPHKWTGGKGTYIVDVRVGGHCGVILGLTEGGRIYTKWELSG